MCAGRERDAPLPALFIYLNCIWGCGSLLCGSLLKVVTRLPLQRKTTKQRTTHQKILIKEQ